MLEKFINIEMISSPVNWAMVFAMLVLSATLLAFLLPNASAQEE